MVSKKFPLTMAEAVHICRKGSAVQPEYFGPGWTMIWRDSGIYGRPEKGNFFDKNPHTGSLLLHILDSRDESSGWRMV